LAVANGFEPLTGRRRSANLLTGDSQQVVGGGVPELVVDLLELIQVDEHDGKPG
jgi:hypothetical protein